MSAFQIPALLEGTRQTLLTSFSSLGPNKTIGVRPGGDGSPRGAYKGGEWYFGIYFTGMRGGSSSSVEGYYANCGVGVDITRILSKQPTAKQGETMLQVNDLHMQIGLLTQTLMQGGSVVSNACNAAYAAYATTTGKTVDGLFRETFDTFTVSPVRTESGEWIAAEPEKSPTIFVCQLAFTGIKFYKYLSQLKG